MDTNKANATIIHLLEREGKRRDRRAALYISIALQGASGRRIEMAYGFSLLEYEERRVTMTKEETQGLIDRVNEMGLDTVTKVGCQLMIMAVQYIEQTGEPPREALETLFKDAKAGKWKFEPPNVSSDG